MPEFEIISFEGALPLRFGMLPDEVASILGPPQSATPNWQGILSYDYDAPNLSVGFGGEGQSANHFGFGPHSSTVRFQGLDLFGDPSAWRTLLHRSSDYHLWVGFLIFCDLGVMLDGFNETYNVEAVVAFPKDAMEKHRTKFKAFELNRNA
jgi:hypothetical protein